jgi:hypothetical protein
MSPLAQRKCSWLPEILGHEPESLSEQRVDVQGPRVHLGLGALRGESGETAAVHLSLVNEPPVGQGEKPTEEGLLAFFRIGRESVEPFVWRI